MRRPTLLLLALAVLASACGPASATAYTSSDLGRGEDGWRGIPLEDDRERRLPDVTLQATDGTPVDLGEDLLGTPTLLFFGYASCPDICPIHMAAIASAMSAVQIDTTDVQVVFVSVDPERDTPERIDEWLGNWNSSFTGLHGDIAVIEDALDQLALPGPVVEGPDPRGEGDLIGHPAQVIGFDADGIARRVWPFGARRLDWINDLPLVVAGWSERQEAPAGEDADTEADTTDAPDSDAEVAA